MAQNYGKAFEAKLKEDFLKVDGATIDRLYDPTSGFHSISNISDFIGYVFPNVFYIECKSHKGNTFPLSNLRQYEKLKGKIGIPGVRAGVVIWFIDHKKVVYVPISTFVKLKEYGKKSFNIKMLGSEEYFSLEIPGKAKRLFIDSDYNILKNLEDGQ
ncbi:MAG: Holliday junction resolvase RecU [Methanobrevibacter sp.]|nr:Holliday junction resolvase RecU [Methanobrevibacter sp.]